MKAPYLTNRVRRGLWLIVARSPTVMDAEMSETMDREEREKILAAAAYAEHHFKGDDSDDVEE
jgi:hypothetical protein